MAKSTQLGVDVRTSGSRGKKMEAMLKALRKDKGVKGYKIGWPSSATYPDGASVAEVALYNEFGTRDENGAVLIPERPFFRNANRNFGRVVGGLIVKFAEDGKITKNGTTKLAQVHTRLVQASVGILKNPPNSEATIAGKGSDNPLVDTGLLRRTVSHELIK